MVFAFTIVQQKIQNNFSIKIPFIINQTSSYIYFLIYLVFNLLPV